MSQLKVKLPACPPTCPRIPRSFDRALPFSLPFGSGFKASVLEGSEHPTASDPLPQGYVSARGCQFFDFGFISVDFRSLRHCCVTDLLHPGPGGTPAALLAPRLSPRCPRVRRGLLEADTDGPWLRLPQPPQPCAHQEVQACGEPIFRFFFFFFFF